MPTPNDDLVKDTSKPAVEHYDDAHGHYKDPVPDGDVEGRLPQVQFPKAPDPKPFKGTGG